MKILKNLDGTKTAIIEPDKIKSKMTHVDSREYERLTPYVDESGIWFPCEEYGVKGIPHAYKCLITKGLFVEAYEKWIKNDSK